VLFLQLLQFDFWKKKAPKFWEILKSNPLSFFEDDGEIALSRLSSTIANSPFKYDVNSTAEAFRFQKIGKTAFQHFMSVLYQNIQIFYSFVGTRDFTNERKSQIHK
jgi:hypothetical protein